MTVPDERIGYSSGWTVDRTRTGASGGPPTVRPRQARVGELLERATAWARRRPDIRGLALVGSWARGSARTDSDVDLVVLTTDPVDPGTRRVVTDGMRILHDPDGRLAALAAAATPGPRPPAGR
jgi:Nucleotidyltransferase domain